MLKKHHSLTSLSRRSILKTGVATTAVASVPLLQSQNTYSAEFTNEPTDDTVTIGFTVPRSGAFSDEGAEELRAFQLAVKHLNGDGDGGMLNTMQPTSLQGTGILGKRVNYVVGDTQTRSTIAAEVAQRMINDDGVIMISGGSSSGVASILQSACQDAGIIFMSGVAHANSITGSARSKNGFRHHMNAKISDTALSTALVQKFGNERSAYYLTADYSWGYDNESAIRAATEASGWSTVNAVYTPVGTTDFSEYLTPILTSGADTLILSHYGKDMVNSLTQAAQLGLRDLQTNGNEFVIAIPLYSRLMAQAAGDACEGVYGTINWHSSLQDTGSLAFISSYTAEYGFPPSTAAHTCYVQTLLYADACERASTFDPCQVIAALEGHQFDGLGNGSSIYRAEDHQCFNDVLVVKGRSNSVSAFDRLEVTDVIQREAVEYPSNAENVAGELGACNNGSDVSSGGDNSTPTETPVKSKGGSGTTSVVAIASLAALAATRISDHGIVSED